MRKCQVAVTPSEWWMLCSCVCNQAEERRPAYTELCITLARLWKTYRFFFEHSESRQTNIHRNTHCFFFAPCSHITGGQRRADLPEGETTSSRNVLACVSDQAALFNKIRFLSLKCSQFLKTKACGDRRRDKAQMKTIAQFTILTCCNQRVVAFPTTVTSTHPADTASLEENIKCPFPVSAEQPAKHLLRL